MARAKSKNGWRRDSGFALEFYVDGGVVASAIRCGRGHYAAYVNNRPLDSRGLPITVDTIEAAQDARFKTCRDAQLACEAGLQRYAHAVLDVVRARSVLIGK